MAYNFYMSFLRNIKDNRSRFEEFVELIKKDTFDFQTSVIAKYWHETKFNATAQRQYLRVGGLVQNYSTGNLGSNSRILTHEMGHCLFLDDLYDNTTYNWKNSCRSDLKPEDSIMFGSNKIEKMDHIMLRHTWNKQKEL